MIKKFKKFRFLIESSISNELIDQLDYDQILKWYENHHSDLNDIISMSSHIDIMNCFDDEKYKEDSIKDLIISYEFSEFDKDDLLRYIKKKIDDEKKSKILEIYNKNNYDEDDEDSVETEYRGYMLDELDKDELCKVIENSNEEEECTEWIIEGWYSGSSGIDIFDELCGYLNEDGYYGSYKYGEFKKLDSFKLYNIISNYIDNNKLIKNWINGEDYEYKKNAVEEDIYNSPILQRYLIKKDPNNASKLLSLWIESKFSSKNIGNEYIFQKAYINQYLEDNIEDENDEEEKTNLIEDALQYLHDEFGIDDETSKKYTSYMWKIFAKDKYNL